ncbi:hypothetical protein LTR66_006403 [Elasticomyces elasticus]|nr:hypothetical protein LTR66_006403 [Elasticomyces elasticus]
MGLIDSLRAKVQLYKLEQRYTRRDKRTTYNSGAHYVDGGYVYASPECTGNGRCGARWQGTRRPIVGVKEMEGQGARA